MFPNMNETTAFLSGLIAFSLLYGVYFVLFLGSLHVLLYKKVSDKVNYIILVGSILQFVLITACYGIRWDRVYTAFITNGDIPNGPLLFFAQLNDWREVSSTALWAVTGALGDVLFIYRLYVVWDCRLKPCLVPLTLLVGSVVTTIGMICVLDKPATTAYAIELRNWVFAFLSFNLVQNILVNALIIVRIWRINVQSAFIRDGANLWPVIVVLMESGVLYSSFVFVFLVTYACQNNASMMLTDMVPPIMGIAFNIIIVRVGWTSSKNRNTTSKNGANSTLVFAHPSNNAIRPYPLSDLSERVSMSEDNKRGNAIDHCGLEYP